MSLKGQTVAVTGATGFIGGYLVRALLEQEASVVAVVRNPAKSTSLLARGVQVRKADLHDVDSMVSGFADADAVMANAGVVSLGRESRHELLRANVDGTRNVIRAAHTAGVSRIVLTSSASAYRRRANHEYVETDPLRGAADPTLRLFSYPVSKAVAETEAWRLCDELGIGLSVARPGGVYGAFDRTGFTRWFLRLMGLPMTVFPTHLYVPNVYAGDLATAMVQMLVRQNTIGRSYNVAGDPDISYWDVARGFAEAGGRLPRVMVPIPIPIRFRYNIQRATNELGFRNRPVVDAFREILALQPAVAGI